MALFTQDCDMVVGVRKSHSAVVLCHENAEGFLEMCINRNSQSRQDVADFYEINGAVYVINPDALRVKGLSGFTKRIKYQMAAQSSVDIDDMSDWAYAEFLLHSLGTHAATH
jgi:N-acylneuraminate cytidylyltransferase